MTTEQTNGGQQEVISATTQEQAQSVEMEPTAPQGMSDEEIEELRRRAAELVSELGDASGVGEMELVDRVAHVGTQAQQSSGTELELLRRRVGEMVSKDGVEKEISGNMVSLRLALNQINPDELSKPRGLRKAVSAVPFVSSLTPALNVLEKIAIRYEPVSRQIEMIETKLREGRMMLTKDNVELRQLYERVEAQHLPIQKNAFLGELLMNELQQLLDRTEDPAKKDRIQSVLHDVAGRVQDLRGMEAVYSQFFVSIDMTRQNNSRLGQAVERTLSVATNVVMVGLAIQTALSRQRRIAEATARTREFIGDMLVANATAIKQHTEEIGEIYNNPVIAMDKIAEAHATLLEAMDTADRLKQEGIDTARENIAKLTQMSADMQKRATAIGPAQEVDVKSLEA